MNKYLFLIFVITQILNVKAQNTAIKYEDSKNEAILTLSTNSFFQFQNLKGLIKEYSRGKWTYDNVKKQYILTEIGYSTLDENSYISQKAPKFPYKSATRTTILQIEDQKSNIIHQEIEPKEAIFENDLKADFFIKK